DNAANRDDAPPAADTTTVPDTQAAESSATSPRYSTSNTFSVSYSAGDAGSGVDKVELWARAPGETAFAKVATSGDGSFSYTAAGGDGSYAFYKIGGETAGDRVEAPAAA